MRWPWAWLAIAVLGLVAGCSPSGGQNGASPTPLSRAALQASYVRAAAAYDVAERSIPDAEQSYCVPSSTSADLARCEAALSQDRQDTIAYDNAVHAIAFPPPVQGDVTKLLSDDGQLEALLEQAATAPSLAAIDALRPQIVTLLSTTAADAGRVRSDIGLAAASAPPGPSASPAA